MPRSKQPPEPKSAVVCAAPDCAVEFVPARSTARYHSATCRQRATRARRNAAESVEADDAERAETGSAEHQLVTVTRRELEKADAVDTVDGQLALQMARKLTNPEETGFSALSKEFRAVLAAAKGVKPPAGVEPESGPGPEDGLPDELKKARALRDAAREAAGQA